MLLVLLSPPLHVVLFKNHVTKMGLQFTSSLSAQTSSTWEHMPIKCSVIRIFGNSLYPLQQPDQGSVNLDYILQQERQEKLECIRVWVVNRIVDEAEKKRINNLLKNEQHILEIEIEKPSIERVMLRPKETLAHLTDINHARNVALTYVHGIGSEWNILLDGNTFVTSEGYNKMVTSLNREFLRGKIASFVPMTRITKEKDSEKTTGEIRIGPTFDDKIDEFEKHLSGLQEPHLALHYNFLEQLFREQKQLFDSSKAYGKQSKLYTLRQLDEQYGSIMACRDAFHRCTQQVGLFSSQSRKDLQETADNCGYTIRMLYWPNNTHHEGQRAYRPPEENNSSRYCMRALSVSYLTEDIKEFLWNNYAIS